MQIIDDIWSSIKGNARARVNDPILGTFIVSWLFCNWDKVATLIWGTKKFDERVHDISQSMAVINNPRLIYTDWDLIVVPAVFTLIYLFVFPRVSLFVKKLQIKTMLLQHQQAVSLDITREKEQKELNKEKLRADPNKEFLAQDVEIEIATEKDKFERRKKLTLYISKKATRVQVDADERKMRYELETIEVDKKRRQEELEKTRHLERLAITNASAASHRFPASYFFMDLLSKSLLEDDIIISLDSISECISAVFGYDDFSSLINDASFNNANLFELKYIYHDSKFLIDRLEGILEAETSENENLDVSLLFDHIQMIFENLPYKFLSADAIADEVSEDISINSYELLNDEGLSGAMAETDTIFDEVHVEMDSFEFENGLTVMLSGYASGEYRNDSGVKGQDIHVNVEAHCLPILGLFGLKNYELEVSGKPSY